MGMESIRARDARRGTAERERTRQAERREDRQYREEERRESRERTEKSQLEALRRSLAGTGQVRLPEVQTADRPELMRIQRDVSELEYRRGRIKGLRSEIATERAGVEKGQERDALEAEWAEMEGDPKTSQKQSSAALRVMNRKRRGLFTRGARLQDQGFRAREPGENIEDYIVTARKGLDERKRLGKEADREEALKRTKASELRRRIQTLDDLGIPRPASLDIDSVNKSISGFKGKERDLKVAERKEKTWKALDDRIAKHKVRQKEFNPDSGKWEFTGETEWTASPGVTKSMRRQFEKQRPGANIPIDLWTAEENDDFEFQAVKKFPELQDPSFVTRLGEILALGGESEKVEARDLAEIERANAIADFQLNFVKAPGGKASKGATPPPSPAAAPRKRLRRPQQGPIGQRSNTDVLNTVLGR
jgi:hypothetical protein